MKSKKMPNWYFAKDQQFVTTLGDLCVRY